jgi:hypothetical protein
MRKELVSCTDFPLAIGKSSVSLLYVMLKIPPGHSFSFGAGIGGESKSTSGFHCGNLFLHPTDGRV